MDNIGVNTISPPPMPPKAFTDPAAACAYVAEIYERNTGFIREHLANLARGIVPPGKVRAYYPQAQVTSQSYAKIDSTLPFGSLHSPGVYRTTLTAPDLFRHYLTENFGIILRNHGGEIEMRESLTPIPVHFAVGPNDRLDGAARLVVTFRPDTTEAELRRIVRGSGARIVGGPTVTNAWLIGADGQLDPVLARLRAEPAVTLAEPLSMDGRP